MASTSPLAQALLALGSQPAPQAQAQPAPVSNPVDPAFILERIKAALTGAGEGVAEGAKALGLNTGSLLRYGVTPDEKQRLMIEHVLPGAPGYAADPAAAERYASNYLGAKMWGPLLPALFNALALDDRERSAEEAARIKAVGRAGAATAAAEDEPPGVALKFRR